MGRYNFFHLLDRAAVLFQPGQIVPLVAHHLVNIAGHGRVVSHDVAAPQTIRLGRGKVFVQHPRAPFQVLNRKGLIHLVLKDSVVLRGHSSAETHDGRIELSAARNSQASFSVLATAGGIRSDLPLLRHSRYSETRSFR